MNNNYVIGLGELLWDCFPSFRRMGGAPANFAFHAGQFGHNTKVISAIGNDKDGDALIKELEKHHLNHQINRVNLPTGIVNIDDSNKNDPHYSINTDVAWSIIPYTKELKEIAENCWAVCFGTLAQYGETSRETIREFLNATQKDCYKIYDINLRSNSGKNYFTDDIIISSLSLCNILKINIDEFGYLSKLFGIDKDNDVETRSKALISLYPNIKILIVTMGTDGSWIFTKDDSSFEKTPKVDVVDVVGAGDSFTGAFIGSILNGKDFKEAHKIAVNVSAYVCTQPDGMPEIPEYKKKIS